MLSNWKIDVNVEGAPGWQRWLPVLLITAEVREGRSTEFLQKNDHFPAWNSHCLLLILNQIAG
jgi:hypothetical protein